MIIWVLFCFIGLPALLIVTGIYLWKLAHRPPRPKVKPAKPAEPMVQRRWDGARRSRAAHERLVWDRSFAEAQLQDRR